MTNTRPSLSTSVHEGVFDVYLTDWVPGSMAKVLIEAQVTTANARAKLPIGVHWRSIDPATHLGYRRGKRGGRWLVRWYRGDGTYRQEAIGIADDSLTADGAHTLSFAQAVSRAREIVEDRRAEDSARKAGPPLTVRAAVEEYIAERNERERKMASGGTTPSDSDSGRRQGTYVRRDAESRLTKHVLSNVKLSDRLLAMLTEADLADWREGLAPMSPSSVRRLGNDFRATLNRAAKRHRVRLPDGVVGIVKTGLSIPEAMSSPVRPDQVLSADVVRRILIATRKYDTVAGWGDDLYRLVALLAATGARFSQVVRLTVADAQLDQMRLMVPVSRKGRGQKSRTHTAIPIATDIVELLRSAVQGRSGAEPLLLRPHWRQIKPTSWVLVGRGRWMAASELNRPWQKILVEAGVPATTVPYALRHSSIVRAITAGLPLRQVAGLHDTSTAMIERHYSAFVVDALDELARRAVVPLLPSEEASEKAVSPK